MKKLLIVEDDPTLRNAYTEFFSHQGYQVQAADDGAEAIKLAKHQTPDLVILDIILPKMDGFEFLKHFKADGKHPSSKVVVLTNLNSPETKIEAARLGANRILHKADYTPMELLDILHDAIVS